MHSHMHSRTRIHKNRLRMKLEFIIQTNKCTIYIYMIYIYIYIYIYILLIPILTKALDTYTVYIFFCAFAGVDNKLYKMHGTYIKMNLESLSTCTSYQVLQALWSRSCSNHTTYKANSRWFLHTWAQKKQQTPGNIRKKFKYTSFMKIKKNT
jgi:hypothetical protein